MENLTEGRLCTEQTRFIRSATSRGLVMMPLLYNIPQTQAQNEALRSIPPQDSQESPSICQSSICSDGVYLPQNPLAEFLPDPTLKSAPELGSFARSAHNVCQQ